MKTIEEIEGVRECSYALTDLSGERTVHRIRILYADDDLSKPVVYASDMSVITEATLFLREECRLDGENTKLQAASAIKLLYCYLELFGFRLETLTRQQAKGFVEFLRGTLGSGASYEVFLHRTRAEDTVSDYLSVARRLVGYLEIEDSPLLKKKDGDGRRRSPAAANPWSGDTYEIGVKTAQELMAPKEVSTPQYRVLLQTPGIIDDLRNRVMVRLMREHGLRVGEALGVALEDISSYIDANGMPRYCIEIRNRVSDAPYQHAKTAMKVRSEKDYRLPEYSVPLAGYEIVTLGYDLAEELLEYIDAAHLFDHSDAYWQRRESTARADEVVGRLPDGQENHYVFLNSLGRPLTQKRWSQILRPIYEAAGIPIDRGKKGKNLSHRLRHGFAMYLKYELHCDEIEIMMLMRHSSVESQKPYDNPTPEDVLRLQERVIDGRA